MCRIVAVLAMVAMVVMPAKVRADAVLEFSAKGAAKAVAEVQSMTVKDGRILVRGSGGSRHLDYLFDRWVQTVTVIDHRKHTVSVIDEAQVDRLNQQASAVQPLAQGLAEQVAKLSPAERKKWQELLGESISLDKIAQAVEPPAAITLAPAGRDKEVSGMRCKPMRIMQGAEAMAELCLADHAAIRIPDSDYATIRALLALYERLARRSQRVAKQFGVVIPVIAVKDMAGVPIELRDLSREGSGSVALRRVVTAPVPPEMIELPAGYASEPFALWQ